MSEISDLPSNPPKAPWTTKQKLLVSRLQAHKNLPRATKEAGYRKVESVRRILEYPHVSEEMDKWWPDWREEIDDVSVGPMEWNRDYILSSLGEICEGAKADRDWSSATQAAKLMAAMVLPADAGKGNDNPFAKLAFGRDDKDEELNNGATELAVDSQGVSEAAAVPGRNDSDRGVLLPANEPNAAAG